MFLQSNLVSVKKDDNIMKLKILMPHCLQGSSIESNWQAILRKQQLREAPNTNYRYRAARQNERRQQ